jgi:hypothetical protein
MSEIFQDGEPVDPSKLQKLQDQITEIAQKAQDAYNLGSRLESNQQQVVFHVKAGSEIFEGGLKAGVVRTQQIDLEWSGDYINVYTTCTVRTKSPNLNIRATLTGGVRQPQIAVWSEKDFTSNLNVHWISVGVKPILE